MILKKTGFFIALFLPIHEFAFASDGIEKGNFRISPELTINKSYSDNIYPLDQNETDDFTTIITPEMTFDVAVVPGNYFSIKYHGDFYRYSNAENFKEDHHLTSLSINQKFPKRSFITVGLSTEDTAVQPLFEQEQAKDYTLKKAYADISLKLGKVTEIGTQYSHENREFDELSFENDNHTRDRWDLHALYAYSQVWPILVQYRYINQNNNDFDIINTDYQSHTVFLGGRWRQAMKLSGTVRVGYTWTEFEQSDADGFDGYAVDTNLSYAFSEITTFTLTAERTIEQSTKSAHEFGDYYVSTGVGLTITYKKWEWITSQLNLLYQNRDYQEIHSSGSVQKDDYYRVGLSIVYTLRRWVLFTLAYHYQVNNSDIASEEYTENVVQLGITFSL